MRRTTDRGDHDDGALLTFDRENARTEIRFVMKKRYVIPGIGLWLVVLIGGTFALRAELATQDGSVSRLVTDIGQWVNHRKLVLDGECDGAILIRQNDPVFLQQSDGSFRQVGFLVDSNGVPYTDPALKFAPIAATTVRLQIYREAIDLCRGDFEISYYTTPTSLDWVAETMLPPARRREIAELIAARWETHQTLVMGQLRPVMRNALTAALNSVEAEIPGILKAHEERLRRLGQRYEDEILRADVVPVVRQHVMPIVEEEALPVAQEVGQALWQRVSLWSFTWRFLYDKSPLPKRDAVRTEFDRFVRQEALPELRSRTDQFIEVLEEILRRSFEKPEVRELLTRNLKRISRDAEVHDLIRSIVRSAVTENETLRETLDSHWNSETTREALRIAGDTLEPTVREIGDLIFGNREKGISPEFSQVLRSQILQKDHRWFVIVPLNASASSGTPDLSKPMLIRTATTSMPYPMDFAGKSVSPLTP
ncbi:MAG: hypothetical protein KDA89_22065 [Planctomycetaceae bacterium]|nr:hypothetical protein [Planctomycetaceae bacterium]